MISLFWCLSFALVPFALPADAVPPDDVAGPGGVDPGRYENLSGAPKAVYVIGDVLCHQKGDRSYTVNGNQFPLCARCTAIYIFIPVGLLATLTIPNRLNSREYVLRAVPREARRTLVRRMAVGTASFLVVLLYLLPIIVDGGLQLVTAYESNNITRVLTGMPAGFILGIMLGSILNTGKKRPRV